MRLQRLTRDTLTPEISRPAPETVVSGDPVHTTWNLDEGPGLFAGIWQSTPGAWTARYEEWEYIRILEGHAVLIQPDGSRTDLRPGDSYVMRPGLECTWEVIETVMKDYVIRL